MAGTDTYSGDSGLTGAGTGGEQIRNKLVKWVFFACAFLSVLTTVAIIVVLFRGAWTFFSEVSILSFYTSADWAPQQNPARFGVLSLVYGTLMITVGSALVALPVGTATAIYLSEYADERIRSVVKPTLEILAGVPTIVYGFFALSFVTPVIQRVFPETGTFNAASASIVVGIMIIPMVSSLSEDAMSAVPDELRNAGYGLGATKFEVSTDIVVPSAVSGILASYILAVSRAIGETMAVVLAAGLTPQITANPLDPVQTMTSYMVQVGTGDVSVGSLGYQSLFAVGITLFVMTFAMNVLSLAIRSRYREEYQ